MSAPRLLQSSEIDDILSVLPANFRLQARAEIIALTIDPRDIPKVKTKLVEQGRQFETKKNPPQKMNEPRFLTPAEIDNLLSALPDPSHHDPAIPVFALDLKSRTNIINEMKRKMTIDLKTLKLAPLGIPLLKKIMREQYLRARIEPGTMIGVVAARGIAAQITQMTLNTFHMSGSSKNVSSGVEAMREVLDLSANRKHESTTIHFRNRQLTFDQLLSLRSDFVGVTIGSLVRDFTIDAVSNLPDYPWIGHYLRLNRQSFDRKIVLRLFLDVNLLYTYRILLSEVADKIRLGSINSETSGVFAIPSPQYIGIIDVYAYEAIIESLLEKSNTPVQAENASMVYLSTIVLPTFDKVYMSGIPEIKGIYPVDQKVLQIVEDEEPVFSPEQISAVRDQGFDDIADSMKRSWYLILDEVRQKITGITQLNLRALLTEAGIAYQGGGRD